jgi:hypothetical protein
MEILFAFNVCSGELIVALNLNESERMWNKLCVERKQR